MAEVSTTIGYFPSSKINLRLGNMAMVKSTANQSLTENLGPNGRIGRRKQKLLTITM